MTNRRGFTIVEIIVVITVIGILLGIVVLGVASFNTRSHKTTSVNTAEEVKLKLSSYFQNRNRYPKTQADVVNYLNTQNSSELATKFSNTSTYVYNATRADGSACEMTGVETCDKYTITVLKSAWKGSSSDNNIVITP